jgi:lichenan operon transcriptional antiterminator
MKEKVKNLLNVLSRQNDWVTAFTLSKTLSISKRSVQNYIKEVNEIHHELISSSKLGFLINDKSRLFNIFNADKTDQIPQNEEDRKKYILKKLLLENTQYNLDQLADELYISPSTLTSELIKVKLELTKYDLIFKTKANNAYIEGLEKNKKKMISNLIFEDSKESFISMDLIQSYLPSFDIKQIKKIVIEVLKDKQFFIDDFSLLNFVLHIAIAMERNKSKTDFTETIENRIVIDDNILSITQLITEDITNTFEVKFSPTDQYDLSLLIMTRVMNINPDNISIHQLEAIVGKDVVELVTVIQQKAYEIYNINLDKQDFTVRFSLHLRNLLIRLQNKIELKNPQMLLIKNTYPFIYDISVFISNLIKQNQNITISEDEIAYIALHIGVLIEEQKALENKIKVLILSPQYFASSLSIVKRCIQIFGDNILITGMITDENEIDNFYEFDLLISTIPVNRILDKPNIIVSNYFTNKDVSNLSNSIENVLRKKRINKIESKLKILFKDEFFSVNSSNKNQNDIIENLSDKLMHAGYVDAKFKTKLFEREAISSSAFMNIAMPHPLEMCSLKSAISVSIHTNPINWNDSKVNIVFMLAIHEDDRLVFKDIFDFISDIISDENKLSSLLKVNSFEAFIKLFASFSN